MKIDLFSIGPITLHGYGVMIGLGLLLCVLMAMHRAKKQGLNPETVLDLALIGVGCGFVGAKLLYVIVEFPAFIKDPLSVLGSEGFVVYGGIILGILAAVLYAKRKKYSVGKYFDLCIPSIPLAQGFGRIGCFLAGCCYGRETNAWFGVVFPEGCMAPGGIKLIPTQLISSAGDFLITIILLLYSRTSRYTGNVGALYLLLYGIGRFCIEFLRDDERGGLLGLSTSQFISVIMIVASVFLFIWNKRRAQSHK